MATAAPPKKLNKTTNWDTYNKNTVARDAAGKPITEAVWNVRKAQRLASLANKGKRPIRRQDEYFTLADLSCKRRPVAGSFDPESGSFSPYSASFEPQASNFKYVDSLLNPWQVIAPQPSTDLAPIVMDTIKWNPTFSVPASGAGAVILYPNLLKAELYHDVGGVLSYMSVLAASKNPQSYYTQFRTVSGGMKVRSNTVSAGSAQVQGTINLACVAQLPDYKSISYSEISALGWGGPSTSTSASAQDGVVGLHVPIGNESFRVFETSGQSDSTSSLSTTSYSDEPGWDVNAVGDATIKAFLSSAGDIPPNCRGTVVMTCVLHFGVGLTGTKNFDVLIIRESAGALVTKTTRYTQLVGSNELVINVNDSEAGFIREVRLVAISGGSDLATASPNLSFISCQWTGTNPSSIQPALIAYFEGFTAGTAVKLDAVMNYEALLDSSQAKAQSGIGMYSRKFNPEEIILAQHVIGESPKAYSLDNYNTDPPHAASFLDVLDRFANGMEKGLDVYKYARQHIQ